MNKNIKRLVAGTLAVLMVAGASANVGSVKLFSDTAITASAVNEASETIGTISGNRGFDNTFTSTNCSVTGFLPDGDGIAIGYWDGASRNITVSVGSNYGIKKVEFQINWKHSNLAFDNLNASEGTLSCDNFSEGGVLTVDDIGYVKELTLSGSVDAGIQFNSVTVYYEENHTHGFEYTADGDTITAQCTGEGECDITEGLTMTISADDADYDGEAHGAALNTDYNTTAFPGEYEIEYYLGNTKLESAPVNPGVYTAKVTVGDATASVEYLIKGTVVTPIDLEDCDVTVDTDDKTVTVTYDGQTVPESEYHVIFFTYEEIEGGENVTRVGTEFPTEAGTYIAAVVANDDSMGYIGENRSEPFTIEEETESSETEISETDSSEAESSEADSSTADSSKADSSSTASTSSAAATSASTTTNPATGAAAAGMSALALAAAAFVTAKKKK